MEAKTKQKTRLKPTCNTCGMSKSDIKGTSLTSWIFGSSCRCANSIDETFVCQPAIDGAEEELIDINEHYETISVIGSGGMGTVYKVRDKTLDQVFALKVLRPELANDKEAVVRFKQEISAAQNLSHPNLVTLYSWGVTEGGSPYFVMDYVEGRSLEAVLKEETTIGLKRTLYLLAQVCEALFEAHDSNIIHRDLKPSNILIATTSDGTEMVKVVDFGIAKILPPPGKDTVSLTKTAEIFGSPAYMSPEQCKGERVDRRSDIYSFGCVMFECLIGFPPFARENPVKTILAHIYDHPPSVRSKLIGFSAPDSVASIVNCCLSKDPADRYESVKKLLADLELLQEEKPPEALNKISKEKRRLKLKYLGFKYFPQTLTILTIVLLASMLAELPWMLTIGKLQGASHQKNKQESRVLGQELIEKADEYNKPYALTIAAEADMQSGSVKEATEKATRAIEIFRQRKDLPNTLIAYRLLFSQALREDNGPQARELALKLSALESQGLEKYPKKGMRLFGWFYLPDWNFTLDDSRAAFVNGLFAHGDTDGAGLLIDDTLAHVEKDTSRERESRRLRWQMKKTLHLLRLEKTNEALNGLDDVVSSLKQFSADENRELSRIALLLVAEKQNEKALQLLQADEGSKGYSGPYLTELLLGFCASTKGDAATASVHYEKAAREYITESQSLTSQDSFNAAASVAKGFGRAASNKMFDDLLQAFDRIERLPEPGFFAPNRDLEMRIRSNLPGMRVLLLNTYATALSLTGEKQAASRLRRKAENLIPPDSSRRESLNRRVASGFFLDGSIPEAQRLMHTVLEEERSRSGIPSTESILASACMDALAGRTDDAVKALEAKSLENGPYTVDNGKAEVGLANISLRLGQQDEAMKHLDRALRLVQDPPVGFTNQNLVVYIKMRQAEILANRGQLTEALALFKHGLLVADSLTVQNRALATYSDLLLKNGNLKEAARVEKRREQNRVLGELTGRAFDEFQDEENWRIELIDYNQHP